MINRTINIYYNINQLPCDVDQFYYLWYVSINLRCINKSKITIPSNLGYLQKVGDSVIIKILKPSNNII